MPPVSRPHRALVIRLKQFHLDILLEADLADEIAQGAVALRAVDLRLRMPSMLRFAR
jgi:hypothetical protein